MTPGEAAYLEHVAAKVWEPRHWPMLWGWLSESTQAKWEAKAAADADRA